jgi:hypothetical protein
MSEGEKTPPPIRPPIVIATAATFTIGEDDGFAEKQRPLDRRRRRLVADPDDMRERDGEASQKRPRRGRTQVPRQARPRLHPASHVLRPEDRLHHRHRDEARHEAEKQEGRKLHVELQKRALGQRVFRHPPELDAVDDGPRDARDGDGREGMDGEMAQHHLERERARPRSAR